MGTCLLVPRSDVVIVMHRAWGYGSPCTYSIDPAAPALGLTLIEESTTDCIPIPPPSPHPCCLGPARLQQQQDANHGAVPPEYLAGLRAGRHLSCHLMSPHRRVKQNSPNSLLAVFLIPPTATASLPSRTGGRLTARRNNQPPARV